MSELVFHPRNGYCTLQQTLWGRTVSVRVLADPETSQRCLAAITDKLSRIERNRIKLSRMVYEEMTEFAAGESEEQFTAALYLSKILVDIYRNDAVCVCFTVRSSRRYQLTVERDFELRNDNSIE